MRNVMVFLRDTREDAVTEYLAHAYPFQPGPPWIMDVDGDPVLLIDIYRSLEEPWNDDVRKAIVRSLGGAPTVGIGADVSGRHPADEQARAFACGLLTAFEGVALDDFSDHCWSCEQIMTGHRVHGHPFFDYRGWYEEHRDEGFIRK